MEPLISVGFAERFHHRRPRGQRPAVTHPLGSCVQERRPGSRGRTATRLGYRPRSGVRCPLGSHLSTPWTCQQLSVNNLRMLDPNALIDPDRCEEFTELYVQGIPSAVQKTFSELELEVMPGLPDDQEDRVECNCLDPEAGDHQRVLEWLHQDENGSKDWTTPWGEWPAEPTLIRWAERRPETRPKPGRRTLAAPQPGPKTGQKGPLKSVTPFTGKSYLIP